MPFDRDDKGNVLNPPVIQEHEQRLQAAHYDADEARIAEEQEDYDKARDDLVKRIEKREAAQEKSDKDNK